VYYRPTKKRPVIQERFTQPIKQLIEGKRPAILSIIHNSRVGLSGDLILV
jgi:hypothetical protein